MGELRVAQDPARALGPGELAWAALLPCALVLVAAVVLLGPVLGHALVEPDTTDFWGFALRAGYIRPEPTEHARYLLALLGPLLLGGTTLALLRGRPLPRRPATSLLVSAGKLALVGFVVAVLLYQRLLTYGAVYLGDGPFRTVYFTFPTLVVALAFAAVLAAALGSPALVARLRELTRESRAKRIAAFAAGLLVVALWLLTAFNDDASIASVNLEVWDNIPFWVDEAFAILNGQAPLVDFHAQYAQLWSYVAAGTLSVFGASLSVYTATMIAGTTATMLAVLDVFRRLVASSLLALALFVPFVATSFFMEVGPPANRYGPSNLFSFFPIRYAGPYLLLWLIVRRAERGGRSPPVGLFAVAGLVAVNNPEFGVPALGATLAALLAVEPARRPTAIARLLGGALVGLAAAAAAVAVLTLAVAGAWPRFGMLWTFPRIFSTGFGMLPMPALGFHLAVYVTFAAAVVVGIVRVLRAAGDARLTGALVWTGVFGLGAGAYFVGRSHPQVLINLFSAWALALSLLLVVVVRELLAQSSRRPGLVEALVLVGFGLCVCSIAQTPTPWTQLRRIAETQPDRARIGLYMSSQRAAVAAATRPGEPVALLMREGHRIAQDVGVADVLPYANIDSMFTRRQWVEMVRALRRAGGTKILMPAERLVDERTAWLIRSGFAVGASYEAARLVEFVARS
ncbi:MAG TPA: hypothetical protein VFG31_04950 [Conexibacter sp.]|nr:hypothetical protein [Conexibacter sp.]